MRVLKPKGDRFPASEVTLELPVFAGEYMVMAGLTAAQWRLALVLVSLAWRDGGEVIIEKPRLEQLAGMSLNTATKLLLPLLEATIDLPGHVLHGEPVFGNIQYDGGKPGHEVGRVRAVLSIEMGQFLGQGANRTIRLPADELRQYRSVSTIILRLRLAAAFELTKGAVRVPMPITAAELSAIFGSYGNVATITRTNATTGEVMEYISLSRAGVALIDPAVSEINAACRTMRLKAVATMEGRTWARIDVEAKKLTARVIAPKPITRKIPGLRGRPTRAVVKA